MSVKLCAKKAFLRMKISEKTVVDIVVVVVLFVVVAVHWFCAACKGVVCAARISSRKQISCLWLRSERIWSFAHCTQSDRYASPLGPSTRDDGDDCNLGAHLFRLARGLATATSGHAQAERASLLAPSTLSESFKTNRHSDTFPLSLCLPVSSAACLRCDPQQSLMCMLARSANWRAE